MAISGQQHLQRNWENQPGMPALSLLTPRGTPWELSTLSLDAEAPSIPNRN